MRRNLERASVFAAILAAVFALQWFDGAYRNELGGHPDEAAHYVTGRMVADYVTTSLGIHPVTFAKEYYIRYPKVALGHWPPLFYVVMTGWIVLFGPTYGSVLALMAIITSLFAYTIGRMVRNEYGPLVALAASLTAVAFPFVHTTTACVLADPLVALLSLWAIRVYGRYLDAPSVRLGAIFGLLSSAALLTKGNAAALGLMVPLAVGLGMRWNLLRRLSFWLPALIVVVVCGPWYAATRHSAQSGLVSPGSGAQAMLGSLVAPVWEGVQAIGPFVAVFAAIGVLLTVTRRRKADGERLTFVGFLVAFVVLHAFTVTGEIERRYLISIVPAVIVFFLDGVRWTVAKLRGTRQQQYNRVVLPLFLSGLAVFLVATYKFPGKTCRGYGEAVRLVLSDPELCRKPILICSDACGEGMFVAETVLRDTNRKCLVLRGSKVLASNAWNGDDYLSFVHSPEEVMALLGRMRVGAIVVDASVSDRSWQLHERLLAEALRSNPKTYPVIATCPVNRNWGSQQDGLQIYAAKTSAADQSTDIEIDMRHNLGDSIKARIGPAGVEIRPF